MNVWRRWWLIEHGLWPAKKKPKPPPPPAASWTLNKPVVFTGWQPDLARAGPWLIATICASDGPWNAWQVPGGWIVQAEDAAQHDQAVAFLTGKTGHRAVVATQGGWMNPAPFTEIGVNVCFGEAYVEDDPTHTPDRITWQERHDGWVYAYPVVGTYHGYALSHYDLTPWLPNFGIWLAEEMSQDDWARLAELTA